MDVGCLSRESIAKLNALKTLSAVRCIRPILTVTGRVHVELYGAVHRVAGAVVAAAHPTLVLHGRRPENLVTADMLHERQRTTKLQCNFHYAVSSGTFHVLRCELYCHEYVQMKKKQEAQLQ